MNETKNGPGPWWGSMILPEGETNHWRIGPADLWVQNLRGEWRVAIARGDDPMDASRRSERVADIPELAPPGVVERFAESDATEVLSLTPALADRPIVTRPERPFHVPPGEQVTLYVSTPLWLRISVGEPGKLLHEAPLFRASDTWFGANTLDGEVCYASFTRFVLDLHNTPPVPHRATTAVRIHNGASKALVLDRVKLPVGNLAIYQGADGRLWTQDVTLDRKEDDGFAELRVGKGGPAGVGGPVLAAEPREPETGNVVTRAFSKLLHVW